MDACCGLQEDLATQPLAPLHLVCLVGCLTLAGGFAQDGLVHVPCWYHGAAGSAAAACATATAAGASEDALRKSAPCLAPCSSAKLKLQ